MKKSLVFAPLILALALAQSGCSSAESPGTGTILGGAAIGAGTGALIGSAVSGGNRSTTAWSALGGAAAGAATGAAINSSTRANTAFPVADRDRNNPNYVYNPFGDGPRKLFVGNAEMGRVMRDDRGRRFRVGDYR
jgi:hypothetical protein